MSHPGPLEHTSVDPSGAPSLPSRGHVRLKVGVVLQFRLAPTRKALGALPGTLRFLSP